MAANSRIVLAIGFGGLLLLLAFAGVDSVQKLRQIQHRNDAIRENFLARTRLLEQIRSDLYLSGTYVRDCLLEPNAAKAEAHRTSLLKTRNRMETALAGYRTLLNEAQAGPFRDLNQALRDYWSILAPVLAWNAGERRDRGYAFLRDEVFPRRTAMLRIADQIAGINEAQLDAGKHEVIDMFSQFRRSSMLTIGLTIAVGLILAIFSMRKIVALEMEAAGRYQETATARAELKRLSARLVDAQENDRRAVSRELHDEVGQALTGVRVELANLSQRIRMRDTAVAAFHARRPRPSPGVAVAGARGIQKNRSARARRDGGRLRRFTRRAQDLHLPDSTGVPAQLRAARCGDHSAGHRTAGARMHPDRHSGRWQRLPIQQCTAPARDGNAWNAGTGGSPGGHVFDRYGTWARRHGFHRAAHCRTG
jgi:hypothetical protein